MGGLAIPELRTASQHEHGASRRITEPLVKLIAPGTHDAGGDPTLRAVAETRDRQRKERARKAEASLDKAASLLRGLSQRQHYLLNVAGEKGVSSWLTAYPMREYGTTLNKADFRDAVCLRYGFDLDGLPTSCVWRGDDHRPCPHTSLWRVPNCPSQ